MKSSNRTLTVASFVVVLSWALSTGAQQRNDNNAATYYRRAFETLRSLSQDDQQLISDYADIANAPLTPQVQAALNRLAPALRLVHEGAGQAFIDWGITFEAGPGTMLPHLNSTRQLMKVLAADAKASFATGDSRGASASLAAAYRLSDQSTQGAVIISTLVGASIFRYTNQLVDQAIGEGQFDMAEARTLMEAMNSIITDDPFGLANSIEGERLGMAQWMMDNFTGAGGKDALVDEYENFFGSSFGVDPTLAAISQMSQEDFNSSIYSYDQALVELRGALEHEDLSIALSAAKQLIDDAQNGMFGPMAMLMMPSLDRAIASMIDLYGQMESTMTALEAIAAGPDGALDQRNAALWYLRAIALHDTLDDVTWEFLESSDQIALVENRSLTEAIVETTAPIRSLLHQAVEIRRCHFDLRNTWDREGPTADLSHTEGMLRNALLLRAEFALAPEEDESATEVDGDITSTAQVATESEVGPLSLHETAAAMVQMSRHLGSDRRMKSTRTAADLVGVLHDAIDTAIETEALNSAAASRVASAVDGASDPYPLGYTVGLRLYHDLTTGWLIDRFVERGERRATVMEELSQEASRSRAPVVLRLDPLPHHEAVQLIRALDRQMQETLGVVAGLPLEAVSAAIQEHFPIGRNADLGHWMIDPLARAAQRLAELQTRQRTITQRLREHSAGAADSPLGSSG